MSDSLSPWLCEYIISVAETNGAQLANIPPHKKKKKVQLKEFLTFPVQGQEETYVWAIISDKQNSIPVKFTKEAVTEYSRNSHSHSRFTQHKGAIVSISKFRPIHSRVPLGQDGKPTSAAHLALECNSVSVLGSSGECTFGNPKPITSNPDVKLWSDSLHHPGGAGNVLKERKLQREAELNRVVEPARAHSLERMPAPPSPPPIVKPIHAPTRHTRVNDMASYKARWQFVERNAYLREPAPEPDIEPEVVHSSSRTLFSLTGESLLFNKRSAAPEGSPVGRSQSERSGTPLSPWEQSSPSGVKELELPTATDAHDPNSSIAPPTPGQRIIAVPESSFPPGTESVLMEAETRPAVARKVPRPNSPEERRDMTGPSQVLVPNSDTSQSQPLPMNKNAYKDLWWVRDVLEKASLHKLAL